MQYEKAKFKFVDLDEYAADDNEYEEKLEEGLVLFFLVTYRDGELTYIVARYNKWFTEGKERGEWLQNL